MDELDSRARPHIRKRIITRILMQHQAAGWSQDEKKPYLCTCGHAYAIGGKGDGLAVHQADQIQRALDAPKEDRDGRV